ncbi:glucuronyl hydrolase [Lentzea sp. NBRC 105346]|uniref:glycoside hydrolase family 88 protein n=1 Tax=Lentzea sp. NBRC 105346 TaxID=3032205 RepID=UPI0024A4CD59|nr:glycoside hydrolase family 88 protein [Lentzea sp. NBRC 105346]GLZ32948.1 glucuronyl hydrolase [Lentzea sp. NBRC 105346]
MSFNRRTLFTAAGATAVAGAAGAGQAEASPRQFRQALDYALRKLRSTAPNIKSFPQETKFEKWTFADDGGWVGGFWPGQLWLAYVDSHDEQFKTWAIESALRLAPRRTDTSTHDIGFLFYPSWVTAYRLTGDKSWRDGAIEAAGSLIQRYNPAGRFIRAWGKLGTPDNAGRVIIDCMMNLDLLTFVSQETGDRKYLDIAVAHAETTRKFFPRPDGSTPHVYDFDPVSGAPIGPNTNQGYSPTSCWSRGQAWGIYGFTTMYRRTRRQEFLDTARKLADYALDVLTPDHVPVWDYRSPLAPNDIKDSSAGAIMACGLIDLARATGRYGYHVAALRILDALCDTCLTTRSERADAILARATRNRRNETGIEVSFPYGDYYLMEALLRVLKPRELGAAIGL